MQWVRCDCCASGKAPIPQALSEACDHDNVQLAESLLKNAIRTDPYSRKSLLFRMAKKSIRKSSVEKANPELVRLLLSRGADPNAETPFGGTTPLILAITGPNNQGRIGNQILKVLLNHGAEVVDTGALAVAADTGNLKAVETILNTRGSTLDLEKVIENGRLKGQHPDVMGTALHRAACGGYPGIADILVRRGADICFKDRKGRSVMDIAGEGRHLGIVNRLAQLWSLWDRLP
ncbi:MAG: hypothetical protein Q9216_002445 [Gyalolechia sp. 2 TL-2023]